MAKIDADQDGGGMRLDERFFPHGDAFRGLRVRQTRLQGGDASSDSYCFVESAGPELRPINDMNLS
jgi:selenium-binding protein 1